MKNEIFSIRLQEARQMAGLSMEKLAARMGETITKQSISRYEKGVMLPKSDTLTSLGKALNISESYFLGNNIQIDTPMLRITSCNKLSESDLARLEARLSFWVEQYLEKERMAARQICFVNPITTMKVSNIEEASAAADALREHWRCGDGSIPSILRLLERKGIKILDTSLPDGVFGLSTWADKTHPLIVLDMRKEKTSVERLRFTAGHELGHLLLSIPDTIEPKENEKLCNKFASFFLFPQKTFIEEMGNRHRESLILDELIDLKEIYGVSVAAQVHEAWDIKMISREHYDWWFDEMIKKNLLEQGWGQYAFPETLGREKRVSSVLS